MHNDKTRFEANAPFALDHLESLRASYRRWTGKDLVPLEMHAIDVQGALFDAPFALLSHGPGSDPVFNYGNRLALRLFEMEWDEFLNMPSRLTTDPADRAERQRLLDRVSARGYVNDYSGIRVSKSGRRFRIRNATVWNVVDTRGAYHGQAAMIREWEYLDDDARV